MNLSQTTLVPNSLLFSPFFRGSVLLYDLCSVVFCSGLDFQIWSIAINWSLSVLFACSIWASYIYFVLQCDIYILCDAHTVYIHDTVYQEESPPVCISISHSHLFLASSRCFACALSVLMWLRWPWLISRMGRSAVTLVWMWHWSLESGLVIIVRWIYLWTQCRNNEDKSHNLLDRPVPEMTSCWPGCDLGGHVFFVASFHSSRHLLCSHGKH